MQQHAANLCPWRAENIAPSASRLFQPMSPRQPDKPEQSYHGLVEIKSLDEQDENSQLNEQLFSIFVPPQKKKQLENGPSLIVSARNQTFGFRQFCHLFGSVEVASLLARWNSQLCWTVEHGVTGSFNVASLVCTSFFDDKKCLEVRKNGRFCTKDFPMKVD